MATIPENIEKIFALTVKIEKIADSRPPNCKKELYSLANAIRACAINCRRRPQHRTSVKSDPMTPQKVARIWQERKAHPDWSQQKLAQYLNINSARVSEVLYGKRR